MKSTSIQKNSNLKPSKKSETKADSKLSAVKTVVFRDPSHFLKDYSELSVEELFDTAKGLNAKYVENDIGFPLRKYCPDSTSYLKQHHKIPPHQRRILAPILQLRTQRPIDVKDDTEFYDSILDVLEHTPSFLMVLTLAISSKSSDFGKFIGEIEDFFANEFSLIQLVKDSRKNHEKLAAKYKKNGAKSLTTPDMTGLFFSYCFYIGLCIAPNIFHCEIDSDFGKDVYDVQKREFKIPKLPAGKMSGTDNERLILSERLIVLARRLMGPYNVNDFDELYATIEQLNAWKKEVEKKGNITAVQKG